jgi:NADPH:quinone reductase-like Zn-dependent oxidoreductase
MKAIQYSSYGGVAGMALVDARKPEPGADEVLVRVRASGVNPVDIAVSEGHLAAMMPLTFPVTAGSEIAGDIEICGANVRGFADGDAVHAVIGICGAFAEYAVVKTSAVARKPTRMSYVEAAGLPIAATTATAALNAGTVGPGVKLFVHAAARRRRLRAGANGEGPGRRSHRRGVLGKH